MDAQLVIIAVPVQAIAEVAAIAVRAAPADAAIIHCGGVQSRAALGLDEATYDRVIGAHPLAGSHDSGFAASRADLFAGCTVSIQLRASQDVRGWMKWSALVGAARLEYRVAEEHDAMMAWVSHLPQLASTALAATFAAEHSGSLTAWGPGARDTTRLAAKPFEQWSSLVKAEPKVLAAALGKLEHSVASIREALGARRRARAPQALELRAGVATRGAVLR